MKNARQLDRVRWKKLKLLVSKKKERKKKKKLGIWESRSGKISDLPPDARVEWIVFPPRPKKKAP